jgi:hypothetical protein
LVRRKEYPIGANPQPESPVFEFADIAGERIGSKSLKRGEDPFGVSRRETAKLPSDDAVDVELPHRRVPS